MKSKKLLATLAILACGLAAFIFWRQSSDPSVSLEPSAAVGEVLAEEISRLLGGKGTVVLLSRQPPKEGPDANRERIESLEAALKRRPTLRLAAPDWLPRPPVGTMDLGVVTPEQFMAALDKNPEANAFVVFAGLPHYSQALAGKVNQRSVKLVAVCGYRGDVRRWLESKALAIAVVPRFDDPPANAPAPNTPKAWFDREFQMFTPETLSRLPY